jgi:hypothetical protein
MSGNGCDPCANKINNIIRQYTNTVVENTDAETNAKILRQNSVIIRMSLPKTKITDPPPYFVGYVQQTYGDATVESENRPNKEQYCGTVSAIAFSGWVDPSSSINGQNPLYLANQQYNLLQGTYKYLTLGSGSINGIITNDLLNNVYIPYLHTRKFSIVGGNPYNYTGIVFDIEYIDASVPIATLIESYKKTFLNAKTSGYMVIVTVAHNGNGISALMPTFLSSPNIDYLAPKLYTNGNCSDNPLVQLNYDWSAWVGITPKIIPIVTWIPLFCQAQAYFPSIGIPLSGGIIWNNTTPWAPGQPSPCSSLNSSPQSQFFVANGTFTPPAGVTAFTIVAVGAGGGLGTYPGGGGGCGAIVTISDIQISSPLTISIGGGGGYGAPSASPPYGGGGGGGGLSEVFGNGLQIVAGGGGGGGSSGRNTADYANRSGGSGGVSNTAGGGGGYCKSQSGYFGCGAGGSINGVGGTGGGGGVYLTINGGIGGSYNSNSINGGGGGYTQSAQVYGGGGGGSVDNKGNIGNGGTTRGNSKFNGGQNGGGGGSNSGPQDITGAGGGGAGYGGGAGGGFPNPFPPTTGDFGSGGGGAGSSVVLYNSNIVTQNVTYSSAYFSPSSNQFANPPFYGYKGPDGNFYGGGGFNAGTSNITKLGQGGCVYITWSS